MGTFTYRITLRSAIGDNSEELEALVDTQMPFAMMPTPVLERLGVRRHRTIEFRAGGSRKRRTIGQAKATLENQTSTILCVFGEADSKPMIGTLTLETFLLEVDREKGRLVTKIGYL